MKIRCVHSLPANGNKHSVLICNDFGVAFVSKITKLSGKLRFLSLWRVLLIWSTSYFFAVCFFTFNHFMTVFSQTALHHRHFTADVNNHNGHSNTIQLVRLYLVVNGVWWWMPVDRIPTTATHTSASLLPVSIFTSLIDGSPLGHNYFVSRAPSQILFIFHHQSNRFFLQISLLINDWPTVARDNR